MIGLSGSVVIIPFLTYTNSGNNKTIKVKFGGTTYHSGTVTTQRASRPRIEINNRNSASSQIGNSTGHVTFGAFSDAPVTSTVDTTQIVPILITGQLANSGESLVLEWLKVEIYPY
jgi:hypothetical protein